MALFATLAIGCDPAAPSSKTEQIAATANESPSAVAPRPSTEAAQEPTLPSAFASVDTRPPAVTMRAVVDGKTILLPHGVAFGDAASVHVAFGDKPFDCSGAMPSSATTVEFTLPPGPSREFYAGFAIGRDLSFSKDGQAGRRIARGQGDAVVELAAVGARVRGRIASSSVSGAFDLSFCPNQALARTVGLPSEAPSTPFSGTVAGQPFTPRSALALVEPKTAELPRHVDSIYFFEQQDVPCDLANEAFRQGPAIELANVSGGAADKKYRGPQPASARWYDPSLGGGKGGWEWIGATVDAWVRFDQLSLAAGGSVRGAAVIEGEPGARITGRFAGRFEAKVCEVPP